VNKRKLLTDRQGPPGSMTKYLVDTLVRIKQESSEEFVRTLAEQAILKVNGGNPLEEAIYNVATKAIFIESDIFIMKAKQAIADAERILNNG